MVALRIVSTLSQRITSIVFIVIGGMGKYTCIKITSAPHSAREMATAWPIPLVPPVITAVWPSRENIAIVAGVAMLKISVQLLLD